MTTTARDAYQALTRSPHYPSRGCAPDPTNPRRAAGNLQLSIDAWAAPDLDGGEDQGVRRRREEAAIEVCIDCPVMVLCLQYATSILPDGRIAEPHGVFGGTRALERHREHIRTRQEEDALRRLRTPQKQAVLHALVLHEDAELVAAAAGLDVRTANWQRSAMATLLGLDKHTATREEILTAARHRGLLPAQAPAAVPAAPASPQHADPQPTAVRPIRIPAPDRRRFTAVPGQLDLDHALADHRPHPHPHLHLVPQAPEPVLEAAA